MSSPSDEAKQAVNRIPRVAAGMGFDAEDRPKTNDLVLGRRTSTPFGDRGVLAEVLRENLWVTNSDVSTAVFSNNVLYLGGVFTYVGPATGGFVALDLGSGAPLQPYPLVVGKVYAVVSDGSGGWYIGGIFTAIRGQPRNNLAHLDASGNLTAWDPNANGEIRALVVSGSSVYAGGYFTSIDGQARNHLAALDATTGVAISWDPNANDAVYSLAVSGSTIYAGGTFTSIGGQTRNHLAALDATSWNPNADDVVRALTVSTLNHFPFTVTVYVGGAFTHIGGQARNHLAALDATTGALLSWNPNADSAVLSFAQDGNTVYVGGAFTSVLGETRWCIAGLSGVPIALDGPSGTGGMSTDNSEP